MLHIKQVGWQKCAEMCNNICACPLKETLTVFVNVIVRGHIVHKVFAAVWHKTSVKSNAVLIFWRHIARLQPTLDVTIQVILKIDLLLILYLRAIIQYLCYKFRTCLNQLLI